MPSWIPSNSFQDSLQASTIHDHAPSVTDTDEFPVSKAECCSTMSHHYHEIPSLTVDRESLLSFLSLSSTGVCEVVVPPDSLKDLSLCNLLSMVAEFLKLVRDVHLPCVAEHLVK